MLELLQLRQDLINDGFGESQVNEILEIAKAQSAANLELVKLRQIRQESIRAANTQKELDERIATAQRGGRELSNYEKTKRDIDENYKNLPDAERQKMLDSAAKLDALKIAEEAQKQIEQIGDRIEDSLSNILEGFRGGVKSGLKSIWQEIKSFSDSFLNGILKNVSQGIAQTIFGGGGSSSGGGFSGLLQKIFGSGGGGGSTPPFVGNDILSGGTAEQLLNFGSSSGGSGSFFSKLFGNGGIFGEKGFGNNVGTFGAIGAGANLLGGLLGGRLGSTISGAGSGLALGATIGSIVPGIGTAIGAGVGAIIGGLVGLFGGGTRRQEETVHDRAMTEALKGLNEIKGALDGRPPQMDSTEGVNRAREIASAYFNTVDGFKDSKTKRISRQDGENRITPLVASIVASADAARAFTINRQNTSSQFVGEFAGGVYMDAAFASQYNDFKRQNGLMPGTYNGRDYIKALIGDGEMVLNAAQIASVIANSRAGDDDPFARAGIPGYVATPQPSVEKFNSGVSFAAPTSSPNKSDNVQPIVFSKGAIEIYFKGERLSDGEIERIAINGNNHYISNGGRRSEN